VAYAIQLADAIATVEAAGGTVTMPAPTPPPSTLPSGALPAPLNLPAGPYSLSGTPNVIFAGGVLNWDDDFSYGGLTHSIVADPLGTGRKVLKCVTPQGTGGVQPGYQNPPGSGNVFPTAGIAFLNVDIMVTTANNTFVSACLGAGDAAIPGAQEVTVQNFGGPLTVGAYVRYKIPTGAAGYNLGAASVLKTMLQENDVLVGNEYFIDNWFWSED